MKLFRSEPMLYLQITFNVKVQEVGGQESVATEAKKLGATCVVFDRLVGSLLTSPENVVGDPLLP